MANQILGATNPQQAFSNFVNQNEGAKNALELCKQYGGDPKAAFMSIAAQKGKESIAKTIMSRLGIG